VALAQRLLRTWLIATFSAIRYIQVLKLRAGRSFGHARHSWAAISCARSARSSACRA
jgi:hypothetical protein